MTAPLFRLGACCASGNTRRDPWTGDERCAHCGLPVPLPGVPSPADLRNDPRPLDYAEAQNVAGAALHGQESPEPVPPPILGGQGRDASEVEADAVGTVRLVVLAILSVGILALGVWAAGG